jgi:hypothetical protein
MMEWLTYAVQLKPGKIVRNAEAHQLIQESLAAQQKDGRFYYPSLAALGRSLAALGEWLQNQYDTARNIPLDLPPLDTRFRE